MPTTQIDTSLLRAAVDDFDRAKPAEEDEGEASDTLLYERFSKQHDHQLDWDEDVVRSLPFALAALALAATGAGFVVQSSGAGLAIMSARIFLGAAVLASAAVLLLLGAIVRRRQYLLLTSPSQIAVYRQQLEGYHGACRGGARQGCRARSAPPLPSSVGHHLRSKSFV